MARPTGLTDPATASPLPGFHSLLERHVAALSGLAWAWSLDRHEDRDGDPAALPGSAERYDPSLAVSRKDKPFHLSGSGADQNRRLGAFASLGELTQAVTRDRSG